MTKLEIIKQIARETGVEATTVSAVVEGFMEEVRAAQIRKENVFLRSFGTFAVKHRKEKTARNISSPLSVRGCLSSPSIAARGHVATSAPASRH